MSGHLAISIHGSREGPDTVNHLHFQSPCLFQSTGPVRDPTKFFAEQQAEPTISIHGSREGPDINEFI
ncbi:hypothetical protein GCWU000342_00159 [Shuttleworthella satelles DSM 14600]|uniref:Uncharacterized protein n=1 Tax=Shuttleworthella satelles DSM 14600 TaxID=626523 RepID=C4G7Z3_9FIRM|nr:hypothetical protein GCWU000342_00159 [Shuttleworthia satelles DSM 14600]